MNAYPWHRDAWRGLTAAPERLPHALLLHGPAGVGKRSFALALARWLLCKSPTAEGGCGTCPACNWFEQGAHPDFRLIEPEAEAAEAGSAEKKGGRAITIQAIRELGEFIALAAHQGGWRVVVLQPAEALNAAAANALLKTLEEPPANVLLILVAHQPRRLPATVRSRCRKLVLPLPAATEAAAWLAGQGVETPASPLAEAGGAPLLALDCADVERSQRRERLLDRLATLNNEAALLALAPELQARPAEAWGWLTRWLHDLGRVKAAAPPRYFPERYAQLSRLAPDLSWSALLSFDAELREAGRWLRHPLNSQLLLESWLIRYAQLRELKHG